jgi:alginate O-acetyltransferase complex protein AlgI
VLFNSFIFLFAFLPVTYGVFWLLRSIKARYVWLTVTGYVFYGYWDPRFCLLMAFSTAVSYTAGLGFLRWSDPRRRKLCLVVPIVVDLALLGFFKYANWGLETLRGTVRLFGADVTIPHLDVILPVGISFYTFHTISYIVDAYRGTIRPTRNFFEFSTYVSLFSQLVAGPIVRFRQIEEDLEKLGQGDRTRWLGRGVSIFVVGLMEKVLVADSLAAFVDPALARYESLSTAGCGSRCWATPSSSTSTSRATARWRWGWATCSASASRRTSTRPTRPPTRRTSGAAGTSRSRRSSATTSTSPSAAAAAASG